MLAWVLPALASMSAVWASSCWLLFDCYFKNFYTFLSLKSCACCLGWTYRPVCCSNFWYSSVSVAVWRSLAWGSETDGILSWTFSYFELYVAFKSELGLLPDFPGLPSFDTFAFWPEERPLRFLWAEPRNGLAVLRTPFIIPYGLSPIWRVLSCYVKSWVRS
jgi:hypothetical protein